MNPSNAVRNQSIIFLEYEFHQCEYFEEINQKKKYCEQTRWIIVRLLFLGLE